MSESGKPSSKTGTRRDQSELAKLLSRPRITGKTVYILGSGFSYALGIPVISDFIPRGLSILKSPLRSTEREDPEPAREQNRVMSAVMTIANEYRRKLAGIAKPEPNIEDMFCIADLFDAGDVGDQEQTNRKILSDFIRMVCHRSYLLHEEAKEPPLVPRAHFLSRKFEMPYVQSQTRGVCLYESFLSQVLDEEPLGFTRDEYATPAVISLNYDRVVENKLKRLSVKAPEFDPVKPYYYGFGVEKSVEDFDYQKHLLPIIKLHGSVDWKQDDSGGDMIIEETATTTPDAPLIFPTWQRSSLKGTVFAKLLDEARVHLRLASRIVIIGYSLPKTDTYMRYLLADAMDTPEMPALEIANLYHSVGEAKAEVEEMMGERAAANVNRNYARGLLDLVLSKTDKSSFSGSM